MRLIGLAVALALAGLTPAAAQTPPGVPSSGAVAPAPTSAPQTVSTAPAAPTTIPAEPANAAPVPGSIGHALPNPNVGEPNGSDGLQTQVTPIGKEAAAFHNYWLLPLCVIICLVVLVLLLWSIIRYRRGANPVPSRNSHNTVIEVLWTLVPVLILVGIAIPSIKLLRHEYTPPPTDLTVKVTGHQWYWSYDYPDYGVSFDSHILKEKNDPTRSKDERWRTDADGPPLLAADERMVIPAGKVVKFIVTSDDVIHSFAMPSFWVKIDANPGRLNETWAKVDRTGVFYGQCSELCGARHGFMPINIEAVTPAQFTQWIASKGGHAPGATPPGATDTTAASPVSTPSASAAAAEPQPVTPTSGGTPPATTQPATNQAAVAQN